MENKLFTTVLISSLWAFCGYVSAENARGWGAASHYNHMYNTGEVVNVEGVVAKIVKKSPLPGMSSGIHLLVKAGKESYDVHLGPIWYIENQELEFKIGDKIAVTGAKLVLDGTVNIIAEKVRVGTKELLLRDPSGHPRWAGWRPCCQNNN